MNDLIRRLAPVVALCLPFSALAQATRPDPADPKTAAPALRYPSAFSDYRPWQDVKPGDWRALNDALRAQASGGGAHAGHAMPMAMPPAAPAVPASAPKAPAPAASAPGGHAHHHHHGGQP